MDFWAFADEMEKIAIDAAGMRAAVKRIKPNYVKLPKPNPNPGDPLHGIREMSRLGADFAYRPSPESYTALVGPHMIPPRGAARFKTVMDPTGGRHTPDLTTASGRLSAKISPRHNEYTGSVSGQIFVPAGPGGQTVERTGATLAASGHPLGQQFLDLSPEGKKFVNRGMVLHESQEGKYVKSRRKDLWDSPDLHTGIGVAIEDGNMISSFTGPGSEEGRRAFIGLRALGREGEQINEMVRQTYGGRFPYDYGTPGSRMPAAMKRDLIRKRKAQQEALRAQGDAPPARTNDILDTVAKSGRFHEVTSRRAARLAARGETPPDYLMQKFQKEQAAEQVANQASLARVNAVSEDAPILQAPERPRLSRYAEATATAPERVERRYSVASRLRAAKLQRQASLRRHIAAAHTPGAPHDPSAGA